jgi:cytochrome P450
VTTNMASSTPTAAGAWPLLGHLVPLLRDPLAFLTSLPERGDLVRVRIGPATAVVVCTPDLTRQVLRNDRIFDKGGPFIDRVRELLGDSVGTCPHDRHRRQRRLVQPAFTSTRLPTYAQTMLNEFDVATQSWHDGQILDILAEMMAITSKTTLTTLFAGTVSGPVLRQALDDLTTVMAGVARRMLMPPILDRLPTPANRRYHRAITGLRHTIATVVADRRTGNTDHGDLLSALLTAHDPEADGERLSDTEIVNQAIVFFVGGTESTASLLAWSVHLLGCHPDIADRMRAEVDTVLAGRPVTYADLPRLELTSRVITETLRLYAPGWVFTRTVTTDTHLGNYSLPAGTAIIFSPYLIHHRPDLYDEPERFDPDRWLPDHATAIPRDAYIPFGGGARKCIGDTFSLTEATLTLASITARWHLQPLPDHHVRPALAAALRPRGLRMRATTRTPMVVSATPPER